VLGTTLHLLLPASIGFRFLLNQASIKSRSCCSSSIPINVLPTLAISSPLTIITRHVDYLIPRTRTQLGEQSFSVAGPTTWNSQPETFRAVTNKTAFKHVLKTTTQSDRFVIVIASNLYMNLRA